MDAKTSDWRPGPSVCRCCLTEGCYKDISTEYFWMGKKEVYSEMLSDTFSISIAYSQSGGPNSNSRLICEPCIARLRDASDFRRQVLECEKTFMHHLDPGSSSVTELEIQPETMECEVKLERVKLEKRISDDDMDDRDFLDDDDDDDDLDDEPLTKLASKVPKKESVDLLDLLDNSKLTLKRKSATKAKASAPKKTKTKKESAKPAPSKVTKPEKKKKENVWMNIARRNAKTLVQYTTIYPFRLPDDSFVCVYCLESCDDPLEFRSHMESQHREVNINIAFAHVFETYIKVDISDLRCRICSEPFEKLESIIEHLRSEHGHYIDTDYDLGIHPFKFENTKLLCGVCNHNSLNLRAVSRHIHKHFIKYTCDACGKAYSSCTSIIWHRKYSCPKSPAQIRCKKCKEVFKTQIQLNEHLTKSEMCCRHVCSVCGDRSATWFIKQNHLQEVHGVQPRDYPCPECDLVFKKNYGLRKHFRITHSDDYFQCPCCERRFDSEWKMKHHLVVHTGEKLFVCQVCSRAFSTKFNLTQHMWIHSKMKKHECEKCKKQFNQTITWKSHMKSHHPEMCDF